VRGVCVRVCVCVRACGTAPQIVELKEETDELVKVGAFDHHYPATRIMWAPKTRTGTHDLLATTGDYLRLWNVKDRSEVAPPRSCVWHLLPRTRPTHRASRVPLRHAGGSRALGYPRP
jgi:hypothetical protein